MRRFVLVIGALILVDLLTTVASAEPIVDTFYGDFSVGGFDGGGGTGWNNGEWIEYSANPLEQPWWAQWFYDHPLDLNRWKVIDYSVSSSAGLTMGPFWYDIEVAVNWSNEFFPPSVNQPPTPAQEGFIQRSVVGHLYDWSPNLQGSLVIPDYNPEWVSIDVRVLSAQQEVEIPGPLEEPPIFVLMPLDVSVNGVLSHECVPEPSTFALLSIGVIGLLAYLWRRR